jgi:DNA polymerase-3 subunit gamma/tau
LLAGCSGQQFNSAELPASLLETIRNQAASLPLDTILAGLDILSTTKYRSRSSGHGLVLIEMAVVRLCRLADLIPAAQLALWLGQGGGASAATPTASSAGNASGRSVEPPESSKKKLIVSPESGALSPSNGVANTACPGEAVLTSSKPQQFDDLWGLVLTEVGPMLAGQLSKAGLPAISGPKSLAIRFPAGYSGAYDYCREAKSVSRIEEALLHCDGAAWLVRVELDSAPSGGGSTSAEQLPAESTARQKERAIQEVPLISRAIEVLGARLMKLEEGFGLDVSTETPDEPLENREV